MTDQERVSAARPWAELRAPVAALTFLTRIPVGRWLVLDGDDVARAAPAFPLVGAGIGAVVGGIAAMLAKPLSALLAAGLALAVGAVLTGALHLDALADTADALGARSRERALEIMRDHSIGAYGAVAIALDLLIKFGALSALISHQHVLLFAVTAGALSRMSPVLLAAWLPYARAGPGAGVSLTRSGRLRAAAAVIVAVAIVVAVGGMNGVVVAGCAAAMTAALGLSFGRWLGGITGDTLGAAVELSETTVLVVAVALVGGG
jgi:cobalamin 5'-phosphate synthase/cobalamin synthase